MGNLLENLLENTHNFGKYLNTAGLQLYKFGLNCINAYKEQHIIIFDYI